MKKKNVSFGKDNPALNSTMKEDMKRAISGSAVSIDKLPHLRKTTY
jgi:hypothetical protein